MASSSKPTPPEFPSLLTNGHNLYPTLVPTFDPSVFAQDAEREHDSAANGSTNASLDEARCRIAAGEFEHAFALLERLLEILPFHAEARDLAAECRRALERECAVAVGSPSAVLSVVPAAADLRGFGLDPLSAFLLSLIDGRTDVETVLDLCGRPRLLALRRLRSLSERGIIRSAHRRH